VRHVGGYGREAVQGKEKRAKKRELGRKGVGNKNFKSESTNGTHREGKEIQARISSTSTKGKGGGMRVCRLKLGTRKVQCVQWSRGRIS